jgi:phage/plasmid primase-like uncharacterized protein/archaellum biogenesis ATPase FlaH
MALLPQVFYTKDLPTEEAINQNNQKSLQDCISEAIQAMASHKLIVQNIVLGKMIRFSTHERNRNDKSGWCIFDYQDNVLYGAFGCWRNLDAICFTSRSYRELSPAQQHEISLKIKQREEENERAIQAQHEFVAGKALELMYTPTEHFTHEYINSKQVNIYHNLRNIDNTLFIPLWDYTGKLWNWQKIYQNSNGEFEKRYFKPTEDASGRKQGCFYPIDGRDDTILICEGYSTGATLYETTGQTVICAMDSGNILPVVKDLRKNPRFTQSRFIICADNDYSSDTKEQQRITNRLNDWKQYAEVVMPPKGATSGYDFNDMACSGENVKDYIFPPIKNKSRIYCVQDLIMDTTPPDFLVHGIIPKESLGMIHGASGHKKTFLALHMAYHIGCGLEWAGRKIKSDNDKSVIYLAGEGKHGIKFRFRGLWQQYKRDMNNIFAHDGAFNLNTIDGYTEARNIIKTIITDTNKSPSVIFIDTLHRFLEGDENSSKDAKTMIDACDKIKQEFNCAVILVHHTGLNADDRARGSSSWKASMDFEFNVKSTGNITTMYCKKMKDAEEPNPIVFKGNVIELEGIKHESGEAVTTLLLELSENQEPPKPRDKETENKVKEDTNTLKACWRERGEIHEGRCYVSYSVLKWYAETRLECTPTQAKNMTRTDSNRFIGRLIEAKIIEKIPHQNEPCYFFLDSATNFALINGKKQADYDNDEGSEDIPF